MLKPRTALFLLAAEAGEAPAAGGGDNKPLDPAAAIAVIENKTLPMSQRMGVALNALKGIPPAEQFSKVSADLAAAQAALTKSEGELASANARIKALEADVASLEASNASLEQTNKDLQAKEQNISTRAEVMAKEKIGALGFPAGQLPAADANMAPAATGEEAMEAYSKITDPKARAAYYASHIMPRMGKSV